MEYAIVFGLENLGYLPSQVAGIGGGEYLIIDHLDFVALSGQPEHGFDEVAAFAAGAGQAEKPRSSDDEVPEAKMADKVFPGQLGLAVNAEGDRRLEFGVGGASWLSITAEDVVGAEMYQLSAEFLRDHRDIAGSQSVHLEGFLLFVFAVVNANTGGGIDDDIRIALEHGSPDGSHVGNFDIGMGKGNDIEVMQGPAQISAQLSVSACYCYFHLLRYISS